MGSEWTQAKLGDYIESSLGKMLDQNKNTGEYHCYLGNSNVRWGTFELDNLSKMKFEAHEHTRYGIKKGDLIICEGGEPGRCAIWEDDIPNMKIQKALHRVRTLPGLDSEYLYYWFLFSTRSGCIEPFFTGTTIKHLTGKALKEIPIRIPPIEYQQYGAKLLRGLDKKITHNHKINQTLEKMAQTLFKSWFVDFDPVVDNALDAGFFEQDLAFSDELLRRVEVRKAVRESDNFKPLSEDIRRLFPNAFEECAEPALGLGGWMPKGWMSKSISDAIFINPKVNLAKDTVAKFVDMKALPTSGYSIEEVSEKPFSGGMKFQNNDILLARITPCLENGKTGIVDFLSENEAGFGSTEFIILRGNKNIHYSYIACLARYESFRQHVIQSMVGSSGRQRVQNGCFNDYKIAVPSGEVMNRFADIVSPSFKKLTQNTNESRSLTKLRDTLLPKLISGELSLSDIKIDIPEETLI
ncbi:TPA: restriction endonuclease subunit S [Proteus mirabilis]|uniref:restriction endonuclease subunit S n=1 Tax=Proteus sp. G2674 TaxID=2698886 RepID=UPI00137754D9|nr:restriction endonuclease subunit S [Proteus sp. G2674]NBL83186.1 restriction endonuclease subunit S [Proteus sp. G2674]